jgi:serine phosphatase RsbU (regulator of sigma subunit)
MIIKGHIIKIFIPLLYFLIAFCSCFDQSSQSEKIVNFRVIAKSLPENSIIYIAGNHSKLGQWDPDDVPLTMRPDSSWIATISFDYGTRLEFKFTRGSWPTEAVDEDGIEFPNLTLQVLQDTTISIDVPNWRDKYQRSTLISADRLSNKAGRIELLENWRYHSGDDSSWSNRDYFDQNWPAVNPILDPNTFPTPAWQGIGWFRLHVTVDPSLWNVPLALYMNQAGASELYLDGNLLYRFGTIGKSQETEISYLEQNPKHIVFSETESHTIAVRYSNFNWEKFAQLGISFGFTLLIAELNTAIETRMTSVRINSVSQMIFTTIPITLALLHLLFFLFYRTMKENLFYALCLLGFAAISFINFQIPFTQNVEQILLYNRVAFISVNIAVVFGILTTYAYAYKKLPKYYIIFVGISLALILWSFVRSSQSQLLSIAFYLFLGLAAIELLRVILIPSFKKERFDWIIGLGFIALIVAVTYQLLIDADVVDPIAGNNIVYVYGITILIITMTINLARDFAKTNVRLLNQERHMREQEIQRRVLEADNQRKTRELEEARQLQLSMLPDKVPLLTNLDIAVHMKTATEVGGDYYDFNSSDDGSLTIAIGDATGHGIKAGIMVTLTKSLFNTMGNIFYLPDFFHHCTKVIKRMSLGNMYMAMMLVRIRNYSMTISAAGMPPIYIYRDVSKKIEELVVKGLPLGAIEGFTYQQINTKLNKGDTILLMSDGYAELFNEEKEMLDFPRIKQFFNECAEQTPQEIINYLIAKGEEWRKDMPRTDDITFVILKIK